MEIQDGFVVGIFNYCDRWCETCAFTSRCQLFADVAELEARQDPELRPVVDAPPRPEEIPPPPPRWLRELIDDSNGEVNAAIADKAPKYVRPRIPAEHESIQARALSYGVNVRHWMEAHPDSAGRDTHDPMAVVLWFHMMIGVKLHRAFTGLAHDIPEERSWPADFDGSAKVALLGIERSHLAWLQLVEDGRASRAEIDAFLADLVWLGEAIEREFPNARAFVRPAFDEPDDVARFLASGTLD